MPAWLLLFHSALALAPSHPADANLVRRYALVIGANRGSADDAVLHYAQKDSGEVADVLREMGSFAASDIITLANPQAGGVRDAFAAVRHKIEAQRTGQRSLLLVYYSGHADAEAMHLDGSLLGWDAVMDLAKAAHADLSVLVVDACRSGALTRDKGTHLERPFGLPDRDEELPRGIAIVTSASADESAQESEAVHGSFFTHHFVAGLRGAADMNADGKVTLSEVFAYSAEQAAGDTAKTLAGVQHATYHFHLTGRLDLSLTQPAHAPSLSALRIDQPGLYVFRRDTDASVVLQIQVRGSAGRTIWLPEGRYAVQRRLTDGISEGQVELAHTKPARLDVAQLRPLAYTAVSSKGLAVEAQAGDAPPLAPLARPNLQIAAFAMGGGGAAAGFSPEVGPGLALSYALGSAGGVWMLDGQFSTLHSSAHNALLGVSEWDTTTAIGVRDIFVQTRWLQLSAGVHGGATFGQQSYSGAGALPGRSQTSPMGEALVRADVVLPDAWFITVQGLARGTWEDREQTSGLVARSWLWQPLAVVGVGMAF